MSSCSVQWCWATPGAIVGIMLGCFIALGILSLCCSCHKIIALLSRNLTSCSASPLRQPERASSPFPLAPTPIRPPPVYTPHFPIQAPVSPPAPPPSPIPLVPDRLRPIPGDPIDWTRHAHIQETKTHIIIFTRDDPLGPWVPAFTLPKDYNSARTSTLGGICDNYASTGASLV
ncbi:hypothetical protein RhiJN_10676 [Ceratobasidium sp. AG-Ba]|nr:hypothetical protein RhiJN_10676 [Ceratobasidium sp. AG-Ba]